MTAGKYFLATYGCQMNEYDSEVIEAFLERIPMEKTADPGNADLIIFNTCCIRENADRKVYGRLGDYKRLKALNPALKIVVAGCLAQKDGANLAATFPQVDLVMGTRDIHRIEELFEKMAHAARPIVEVSGDGDELDMPAKRATAFSGWLPVSLGCDCHCTFCIVPRVRGRHRSRPLEDIAREAEALAREGYIEIFLLGQNVNAYGRDLTTPLTFADVLERVDGVPGVERIRYTSPHPRDFTDDFIARAASLRRLCEHVHLPLQSGSDAVLKRMGRRYARDAYLRVVEGLRKAIPAIAITTDVIVGFPGETEEQFEETMSVVRDVRFDNAFMFAYSPREGTAAARMKEQVDEQEKLARLYRLIALQNDITLEKNRAQQGKLADALVEGTSRKDSTRLTGRTRDNKVVHITAPEGLIGRIVDVRLDKAYTWGFQGSLAERRAEDRGR